MQLSVSFTLELLFVVGDRYGGIGGEKGEDLAGGLGLGRNELF